MLLQAFVTQTAKSLHPWRQTVSMWSVPVRILMFMCGEMTVISDQAETKVWQPQSHTNIFTVQTYQWPFHGRTSTWEVCRKPAVMNKLKFTQLLIPKCWGMSPTGNKGRHWRMGATIAHCMVTSLIQTAVTFLIGYLQHGLRKSCSSLRLTNVSFKTTMAILLVTGQHGGWWLWLQALEGKSRHSKTLACQFRCDGWPRNGTGVTQMVAIAWHVKCVHCTLFLAFGTLILFVYR